MNPTHTRNISILLSLLLLSSTLSGCGLVGATIGRGAAGTNVRSSTTRIDTTPKGARLYKPSRKGAVYVGTAPYTVPTDVRYVESSTPIYTGLAIGTAIDTGLLAGSIYGVSQSESGTETILYALGAVVMGLIVISDVRAVSNLELDKFDRSAKRTYYLKTPNKDWHRVNVSSKLMAKDEVLIKLNNKTLTTPPRVVKKKKKKKTKKPTTNTNPPATNTNPPTNDTKDTTTTEPTPKDTQDINTNTPPM